MNEQEQSGESAAPELATPAEAPALAEGALPETLPVLPLKNTVIFPHLLAPLLVNTDRSRKLIDAVMTSPDRYLLSVSVRGPLEGSPAESDLHRVGTVLRVAKMLRFPDGSYRLLVQGIARARSGRVASFDGLVWPRDKPRLHARMMIMGDTVPTD